MNLGILVDGEMAVCFLSTANVAGRNPTNAQGVIGMDVCASVWDVCEKKK